MLNSYDKCGGYPLTFSQTRPLNNAIYVSSLFPISATSCNYTWNNSSISGNITLCKLERSYQNLPLVLKWPTLSMIILPPSLSDHYPLILDWGKDIMRRHASFSFFNN